MCGEKGKRIHYRQVIKGGECVCARRLNRKRKWVREREREHGEDRETQVCGVRGRRETMTKTDRVCVNARAREDKQTTALDTLRQLDRRDRRVASSRRGGRRGDRVVLLKLLL